MLLYFDWSWFDEKWKNNYVNKSLCILLNHHLLKIIDVNILIGLKINIDSEKYVVEFF